MERVNRPVVVKGRPSTVVPANSTGYNVTYSLNSLDISLRPHYIRCVYYYAKHAVDGCSRTKWKESLFYVLNAYPVVAGRSNYADNNGGVSHIRCSDNGIRFVEAECNMSLEDCIDFKDSEFQLELSSTQTIGPDPSISPLAIIQVTRFRCGGFAIGLTWAHVLGDAFSASVFMNTWGGMVRGISIGNISNPPLFERFFGPPSQQFAGPCEESAKSKTAENGHYWPPENRNPMATATFRFSHAKIEELLSKLARSGMEESLVEPIITPFEVVSALIWQILSRVRGPGASKALNLCADFRKVIGPDPNGKSGYRFGNYQAFLKVALEGDELLPTDDLAYLVKIIHQTIAERVNRQEIDRMAEWLENEQQCSGSIYGSELTFVNWENIPCYDMMFGGEGRALHVSYTLDGVGGKGTVVVLPSLSINGGAKGRIVNVTLAREELARLEEELYRLHAIE